ncbi:MAG: hypothetical protein M1817_003799 [Caeruleum heppii]|nr:MAG: hypothetical protein M1817_003799 [Caeruleum heppii]
MVCQPHSRILIMFAVYNLVSVVISYLLATPFFFTRYRRGVDALCRGGLRIGRALSRRPVSSLQSGDHRGRAESTETPFSPRHQTTLAVVMSIGGSIALTIAAPVLTAFVLAHQNPMVDPGALIQQWATRPRASWMVYFVHAVVGRTHAMIRSERVPGETQSEIEPAHGFYVTAATAILNEVVINLVGIKYLWEQARAGQSSRRSSRYKGSRSRPPLMQQGAMGMAGMIVFWESVFGLYVFMALLLVILGGWWTLRGTISSISGSAGTFKWDMWGLAGGFVPLAALSIPVYALSWQLWRGFLAVVSEDQYCVESSVEIDVIYCLLPHSHFSSE